MKPPKELTGKKIGVLLMKFHSELSYSPAYMASDLFYDSLNRRVILEKKGYFSMKNLTGSKAI